MHSYTGRTGSTSRHEVVRCVARSISCCVLVWTCFELAATAHADTFVAPVSGPIRYVTRPVDDGVTFETTEPKTWFTTMWAGRYSGKADTGARDNGTGGHPGVDIRDEYAIQEDDFTVYSIGAGILWRKGSAGNWGNFIAIQHTDVSSYVTVYSIYAHLDSFDALIQSGTEGETAVARGQPIGIMGSTGNVARHLHFQIDRDWPASKNSPYWPIYTNGTVSNLYPTSERDLTTSQYLEAAGNVRRNTVNPMWLVEHGSYGCRYEPGEGRSGSEHRVFQDTFDRAGSLGCGTAPVDVKALFMTVWRPSTRSAENSCGIRQG